MPKVPNYKLVIALLLFVIVVILLVTITRIFING